MKAGALAAVFLATLAIGTTYAAAMISGTAPPWGGAVLALAIPVVLVAFMVLGAARAGARLGTLWLAFGYAFLVLAGGFLLALTLPGEEPGSRLVLGLPLRAAIIMYGIGLFPAFVIPVAYALTFDRLTLSEADLARVRAARDPRRFPDAAPVPAGDPGTPAPGSRASSVHAGRGESDT
jgi:hypothetical protein